MSFNFTVKEFLLGGGTGTPSLQFYKRGFNLGGSATPSWQDIILKGVTALTLVNAKADSLEYLSLFGDTEQRNLPSAFTQVAYLESSGTQYINTGIVLPSTYHIKIKVRFSSFSSQYAFICGARNQAAQQGRIGFSLIRSEDKLGFDIDEDNIYRAITSKLTLDTWYTVEFIVDSTGSKFLLDGTLISAISQKPSVVNYPLYIFDSNTANATTTFMGAFDLCDFQISGLANCISGKNSNSVLGMYDTVTGNFLTNAGTGSFTAGANVVPSPTAPMDIVCNNGVLKVSKNLFNNSSLYNWFFTNGVITYKDGRYAKYMRISSSETYIISRNDNYNVPLRIVQTEITPDDGVSYNIDGTTTFVSIESNQFPFTFTSRGSAKFLVLSADSSLTEAQAIDLFNKLQVELGSTATTYMPYGQIYVDGTVETVEVTGKNLFDSSVFNTDVGQNNTWSHYRIPNGTYTMSTNFPPQSGQVYTNVWILAGNVTSGNDSATNGVSLGNPKTITVTDGWYSIAYRSGMPNIPQNPKDYNWQLEQGSTATDYEPYTVLGTATAENLFKVGTYQDVQSVIDGSVTRNVGIKVLDGSENWQNLTGYMNISKTDLGTNSTVLPANSTDIFCTHFQVKTDTFVNGVGSGNSYINFKWDSVFTTLAQWKQFLQDQYNAGNPVIIVFPLAEPTTETVTAQPMNIQEGTNIVQVTQASMDDLELEVKYKAGVSVTITEIENAQLDDNVEVTING